MISITCTHCHTVLTIDEAFAGGVCRCQHCGTIQTVPAHLKNSGGTPTASGAGTKTLYQNKAAGRGAGGNPAASASPSGLDDLANAVAGSSGLSSSGLTGSASAARRPASGPAARAGSQIRSVPQARAHAPQPDEAEPRAARKLPLMPVVIGGGAVLLVLIGLIIFLAVRGGSPDKTGGTGAGSNTPGAGGATFAGIEMAGPSVVFLLDRGNSIGNAFDPAKAAIYQALGNLGPEKKFAVILWNNGGDDVAYPRDGLRGASPEEIEGCKKALDDVVADGESTLRSALEKAMARQPAIIVIITGKPHLNEDDESALGTAKDTAGGRIKFDAVIVGAGIDNPTLQFLTQATGGQYHQIGEKELRDSVQ
ncbi:MAG TPA: hypothetical protein VFC78_23015 [Tepidisphaeraceae bacterium]|nr:hypothetical protein [Tepidisphaeraceae bacterium]